MSDLESYRMERNKNEFWKKRNYLFSLVSKMGGDENSESLLKEIVQGYDELQNMDSGWCVNDALQAKLESRHYRRRLENLTYFK